MLGEFIRYFFVSIMALSVDMGLLLLLANWIHYVVAASVSFMVGAAVHYRLSITIVFSSRRLVSRKRAEAAIFVATGVAALLVNVAVIAVCIELLGMSLPLAKIGAAGFSFLFGYVVRKLALF
ncbi:MAG: GtrA family protein [Zoogloeaceae bacterium]|nr:GtrA family protein [Zoogloeaceae bacterium]